jgi:L-threonylcarbamoyladenylate synthase
MALQIPEILSIDTSERFEKTVRRVVSILSSGGVVGLPTETVYGLAADATNETAVRSLFELKGRPDFNPLIVHVDGIEMACRCVQQWPEQAGLIARKIWPGPLTMVLEKSELIPSIVTGGHTTVGIRWPEHAFFRNVIRNCGFPIAAPSANLSNQLSPTLAEHVAKAFGNRISVVVDGGASNVGIESTVVDLTTDPPCILRPGAVQVDVLSRVIGGSVSIFAESSGVLKSPGLLSKHYSPRTPMILLSWNSMHDLDQQIRECGRIPDRTHVISYRNIPEKNRFARVWMIPEDPIAYARGIYALMHQCDDQQPSLIVVEAPPSAPEWSAIRDRLSRAVSVGKS